MNLRTILCMSLIILATSMIPASFAWDGFMAMDADKRNVEFGQIIDYQGYLYGDYPIDGEIISVTVYEKETKKTIVSAEISPGTKSIKYFEHTAWPFTFKVDTFYREFSPGNSYVVEATYDDQSTNLEFLIKYDSEPVCLKMLGDEGIIVFTDKENYDLGDTIKISGCLSREAFTKGVNIAVFDPEGTKIGVSTIVPDTDRTFSDEFIIDERFGLNGTYFVQADAGGLYSSSKSFVVPEFGVATIVMLAGITSVVVVFSKFTRSLPKL